MRGNAVCYGLMGLVGPSLAIALRYQWFPLTHDGLIFILSMLASIGWMAATWFEYIDSRRAWALVLFCLYTANGYIALEVGHEVARITGALLLAIACKLVSKDWVLRE